MKEMNIFERAVGDRRYRIASQSVWDPGRQRPFARQVVLGPADPPPVADLALVRTIGTQRVGDVGALVWVAEQLDLIGLIDRACGQKGPEDGPTIGEVVVAVAVQRACAPAAKCHLAAFLESCLPRVSCLPAAAFTGQVFHRLASEVTEEQLEKAQIEIARAAVERFDLSTCVLAFDTTNFDTHIATTTAGELARRGNAKSKRSDLRVVGLATLVSETGHVPLLHRTYAGNGSDQAVLGSCLDALGKLHDVLDNAEQRSRPACRTLVRDGGSWSEQLELDLDVAGYYTLISLPLSHRASELALQHAARGDEAVGWKAGRRAGRTIAHPGGSTGPHAGGRGKSGAAARTEARHCGSAVESEERTAETGTAGGDRPHQARSLGEPGAESIKPRAPGRVRRSRGPRARGTAIARLAC